MAAPLRFPTVAAVLAGIAAAAVHLLADARGNLLAALVAKPIPVLLLAAAVVLAPPSRARIPVVLGLLVAAAGDVVIQLPGRFLFGLGAFLLAHLFYIRGFWRLRGELLAGRALPFALFGGGMGVLLLPGVAAGGAVLRTAVILYILTISTMMWRAAAVVGAPGLLPLVGRLALAGAILFAASDSLIGVHRFLRPLPWADVPIMLLYWAGQSGIACSAVAAGRREARA
ncbi:MAG: lysoplasmalogenase [Thermoanaerobaculia bacterium]